jgi:signal transduction histidine kinase
MWQVFWTWWVGDAVGAIAVAPILLTWAAKKWRRLTSREIAEAAALLVVLVGACLLIFQRNSVPAYAIFPPLIWAALRFDTRVGAASVAIVTGLTIAATVAGQGPFASSSVTESLLQLETFTCIMATTTLLLAAATSERHLVEAQIDVRNQELDNALEELHSVNDAITARRQMTAEIAHELRNPLMTISGYTEAIRDGDLPATTDRFEAILRQTQRLEQLVADLRTLSLADVGKLPLSLQLVPSTELLEATIESFSVEATEKQVRLEIHPEHEHVQANADPGRLSQVLGNLVSNALRHTPPGGSIHISSYRDGEDVVLRVEDTGEGIAEAELPLVFERYYRAEAGKRHASGSGLGLPIVKALVEAHGGSITVHSQPAKGTKFTIRLPAAA